MLTVASVDEIIVRVFRIYSPNWQRPSKTLTFSHWLAVKPLNTRDTECSEINELLERM